MRKKFGNGGDVTGDNKYTQHDKLVNLGVLPKPTKKAGGGMIRQMYKKGKSVKKGYHRTKDGRIAKKGLYYYMNRAKKRGTSKSKKDTTVTAKALKRSAKTAKA